MLRGGKWRGKRGLVLLSGRVHLSCNAAVGSGLPDGWGRPDCPCDCGVAAKLRGDSLVAMPRPPRPRILAGLFLLVPCPMFSFALPATVDPGIFGVWHHATRLR